MRLATAGLVAIVLAGCGSLFPTPPGSPAFATRETRGRRRSYDAPVSVGERRSATSEGMLTLRILMAFALFAGVFIADGITRLVFGALLVIWVAQLVRDVRADRRGTPTLLPPDEPVGPWVAAGCAFLGVYLITWDAFRPPTNDEPGYAFVNALCWGAGFVTGRSVRAAVMLLPRYRGNSVSPSRGEPRG